LQDNTAKDTDPSALRARAARIRSHARSFPDDEAGKHLLALAADLEVMADAVEAAQLREQSFKLAC
jgi:hypothetical protein